MCFGPGSSFAMSAVLMAIGVACIERVHQKKGLLLASVPVIFGVQQIQEGVLWVVLDDPNYISWRAPLTAGFLFIAFLWPVIVPYSIYLIEPEAAKKKSIYRFLIVGSIMSAYLLYFLFAGENTSEVSYGRIEYDLNSPAPDYLEVAIYALSVTGAMFFSSHREIVVLGLVNFLLCAIAGFMWTQAFISVWCFFAALLSGLIYFFLFGQRRLAVG